MNSLTSSISNPSCRLKFRLPSAPLSSQLSFALPAGLTSSPIRRALVDGVLASSLSIVVLLLRGKRDNRSAAAPINAISHCIWPTEALQRDDVSVKHTATGVGVHYASSMLWAGIYGWLRTARSRPTAVNAATDAVAVTALAAVVDLKLVPKRLTPGFEERLSDRSLTMVYVGFAAGLALGGLLALHDE